MEAFAVGASTGQPPVPQSAVETGDLKKQPENIQHR